MSRRNDRDPAAAARRAGAEDRDEQVYARRRARQARRRADLDRQRFDAGPPGEDDWTVAEHDSDDVRRIAPPTRVGDTLEALARRRGWHERLRGATAWSRWEEIVGHDLAQRCEPVRLAGRTLVVQAESQVWATQLRYLSAQLTENANRELGPGSVREIRIVVGPLTQRPEA